MRWTTLESAAAGSFRTLTSSSNEGRAPFQSSCSPLRATDELAYVVAMSSFASAVCEAVKMKMSRAKSAQAKAVFMSQRVRSGRPMPNVAFLYTKQYIPVTKHPASTLANAQQHRMIATPSHSHTMSETHTQLHSPVSPPTSSTANVVSFANLATPSDDASDRALAQAACDATGATASNTQKHESPPASVAWLVLVKGRALPCDLPSTPSK
eukprot:scaffold4360_cov73-Phaeocystis_antarctica.AAC.6